MNKVELSEKFIKRVLDAANATFFVSDAFMFATLTIAEKLRIIVRAD